MLRQWAWHPRWRAWTRRMGEAALTPARRLGDTNVSTVYTVWVLVITFVLSLAPGFEVETLGAERARRAGGREGQEAPP